MKIVKLLSENVKRLTAVEITPKGTLIIVGGKNKAGKSSVLDSIAYTLGGEKLIPTQPIRAGETEAKIVIDLGDLIVTRKFKRDVIPPSDPLSQAQTFGPTTSTLVVTNKEGARYPSPQAVLDKLLGKLTFDPLAFMNEQDKKQNEILRRLVNLDFTLLDQKRKEQAEHRTMVKKTHAIQVAKFSTLPHHPDSGLSVISLEEISSELKKADEYRKLAEEAETAARGVQNRATDLHRQEQLNADIITEMERKLTVQRAALEKIREEVKTITQEHDAKVITAQAARTVVPDVDAINTKMRGIEALNVQVRANIARAAAAVELDKTTLELKTLNDLITGYDQTKVDALAATTFPVPGLGLSEEGVTYNDLPLAEVSSSVQLRVSVAIGLALNPSLKILLIRNGNLLDEDGVATVAKQAEEADAQVWMEYVTSKGEGVAVMIEDGHVAP